MVDKPVSGQPGSILVLLADSFVNCLLCWITERGHVSDRKAAGGLSFGQFDEVCLSGFVMSLLELGGPAVESGALHK